MVHRSLAAASALAVLFACGDAWAYHMPCEEDGECEPRVHGPSRGTVGTERFLRPSHELGVFYGAGGLLALEGVSRQAQLTGFHYAESEGELAEALLFGVPRAIGLEDTYHPGRYGSQGLSTWLSLDVYVPGLFGSFDHRAWSRGFDVAFGGTVRAGKGDLGPTLFQFGVRIAFLWATVPFRQGEAPPGHDAPGSPGEHREDALTAMDALSLRLHTPLTRSLSAFVHWDANLYALFGFMKQWARPSPATLGVQWDSGCDVYARWEITFNTLGALGGDGVGMRGGLGARF